MNKHKPTPRLQKRVKFLLRENRNLRAQCDELCRDLRAVEIRLAYVEGQRDLLTDRKSLI
jgi:hypothetical protein